MAVFLINICKFNGCSKTFQSLSDLISHIEDTHIDYDPKVVEQKELAQPSCLPLSYVLRFISEDARKEAPTFLSNSSNSNTNSITNNGNNGNTGNAELKRKLAIKHHSYSISSSNRSNTPTGSEMDEDEMVVTESEDSNDSWTTEEFSSEFIMRYGSRHSGGGSNGTPGNEKPFACPVPGCKKRYKNVNGIKYHSKNGHKKDGRVRKGYKCHCGKSYKTAQGLKNHALITHNSHPESVLTPQQAMKAAVDAIAVNSCGVINNNSSCAGNGGLMQRSNSPSQSLGSLSPSSSNMSSGTSNSLSSSAATASNMLQQLSNANIVTVTNVAPQQQPTQQQQMSISTHAQTVATAATPITTTTTGNSNNSLMRSTLGLVSIKANHNNNNNVTTVAGVGNNTKSVSNLIAANATANKILKLATNVANGMDITQQQPKAIHSSNGTHMTSANAAGNCNNNNSSTPTKITLPNLVNLGILTPATSPTKNTQTLTFTTTTTNNQQQHQQQQALVASLTTNLLQQQQKLPKGNILLVQEPTTVGPQLLQSAPQQQQLQQQQQHVLPISPTSSIGGNSSKSSSPTPPQQQQQHRSSAKQKQVQALVNSMPVTSGMELMETDEVPLITTDCLTTTANATVDGKEMPSSIAAAVTSGTITVAAIEVVGAGVVNTET
ncbi:CG12054 [Drosophila busckii]|uniref:CG12054 n=1 Tax=Drosophila busckii TaxID=30019 RepID=A0A0M4EHF6_DROBS|nr:myosin-G heavy chain isoform X1 [Drosophila busckii]ALC48041.1 CG12054 [Drosophila busckii]